MRILLWDDDPALDPRTGDGEDGKANGSYPRRTAMRNRERNTRKGPTRMGDVQHYSRRTRKKNLSQSG